tara:strand:- start:296 stop:511 length:216 start_codon:yes stop_codon:yes gene_type:complete
MSKKQQTSLEKIGYKSKLPIDADINDYETIQIIGKDKKPITLYRNTSNKEEIDDTTNFSSSWDVFNSHLNH